VVGRLGERTPTRRPPSVRCLACSESTVDRGRREEDKHEGLLEFDQRQRGEASGMVSRAVVMAYAIRHSKVGLESSRERGARAGF
jgi:hypothetical protein